MKHKHKILSLILTIMMVIQMLMPIQAYAAEAKDAPQIIKIGYINNYHYIYQDEDGNMTGYAVEWLNKIAELTGWEYEYIPLPWSEINAALNDGDIDFCCSAEEITPGFAYSQIHIATAYELLYTLEDNDVYYNDFSTLEGKRIGVIKGSRYKEEAERYAAANGFNWTVVEYNTSQLMQALENGSAFAVVGDHIAPYNDFKVIGSIGAKSVYVKSAENSQYMDDLNYAMSQVRAADEFINVNLYEKYYGDSTWNTSLNLTREEAEFIAACGTISVGTFKNRAPFSLYDASGNCFDGINVAILDRISQLSGLQFELQGIDITSSATEALKSGQYDMVIGISRAQSFMQDPELQLSDPVTANKAVFIGKSGEQLDLSKMQTVAIPAAYNSISLYAEEHFPHMQLKYYDSNYDCMRALQRGEAQVMVESDAVANYLLQNPRFSDLTVYSALYLDQYSCIGTLAQRDPRLISIVNKTLSILSARELGEIELYYTSARNDEISTYDMLYPDRFVILVVMLLTILMFVLFVLIQRFRHRQRESLVQVQIAQAANEAKSKFLAQMSHDIRTPLNAILGLTSISLDEKELTPALHENLSNIQTSGKFLLGLVNDVLDMSKVESGRVVLKLEPYDYKEFLFKLKSLFEPLCQEKGIAFDLASASASTVILADKLRVDQVFFNILSNAIKYTPAGGRVSYRTENLVRTDTFISADYVIEDNGIGMSPDFLNHLFEPFVQEDTAYSAQIKGSGLGMSIAKNLVELMGGTIKVESTKNVGTKVIVHLGFDLCRDGISEEPAAARRAAFESLQGKKILLAEDHPMNAQIATRLLEKKGMLVSHAENGAAAVEMFSASTENDYDAILMDIRMPVMDGLAAATAIRALERADAKEIPIIAMSANAYEDDVQKSLDAGMNQHLAKPIEPALLYQTLAAFFDRK